MYCDTSSTLTSSTPSPSPPPSPPILPEKGRGLATYSWMWDTFCRTFCARIKVFSLARSLSFRENFRIQICTYLSCHILPVPPSSPPAAAERPPSATATVRNITTQIPGSNITLFYTSLLQVFLWTPWTCFPSILLSFLFDLCHKFYGPIMPLS